MNIWMVGTEMAPFSKVGGLGDVLGALPTALAQEGCEVTVVIPYLPAMGRGGWDLTPVDLEVGIQVGGGLHVARFLERRLPGGVRVLFVVCPEFFHREGLYGTPLGDYPDNPQRFALLSYAALEAARRSTTGVDVVHSHDWQSGLIPLLMSAPEHYGADPVLRAARTVHTVHNLSYQGLFPAEVLPELGLSWRHYHLRGLEFYGQINFLKAGLVYADALTTVSPSYAREIQSPDFAWGLHGVLVERAADLHGILNGIDVDLWDPATDPRLAARFDAAHLPERRHNRTALLEEVGLPDDGRPVVGVVNRLVAQKGIELLLGLDWRLDGAPLQWVILGSGEARYEAAVQDLAATFPTTVAARIGFDEALSRRIYGGSDLFCMPSYFEPCGLGQMIALRYGSLPVVRRTGGLADTVPDVSQPGGVGFVFDEPSVRGLEGALERARQLLSEPDELAVTRLRAMALDHSWSASARRYLEVYRSLGGGVRGEGMVR
jgi:starch synthase